MNYFSKLFNKRVQKPDIVDIVLTDPDNLSLSDFKQLPEINTVEDLMTLKKIWKKYMVPFYKLVEKAPECSTSIQMSFDFFKDLGEDKIYTDFHSFNSLFLMDAPDAMKFIQSCCELPEWSEIKHYEPVEICQILNNDYLNVYENSVKYCLIKIAQKIENSNKISKGRAIGIIKEYRNGKYSNHFSSLDPIIRNSAGHIDTLWRPELKKVEFSDGKNTSIFFSLEEYYQLCLDLRTLTISMFYCIQKIREPVHLFIMEKYQTIYNHVKRHNLDIKKELAGISPKDLADKIDNGLI